MKPAVIVSIACPVAALIGVGIGVGLDHLLSNTAPTRLATATSTEELLRAALADRARLQEELRQREVASSSDLQAEKDRLQQQLQENAKELESLRAKATAAPTQVKKETELAARLATAQAECDHVEQQLQATSAELLATQARATLLSAQTSERIHLLDGTVDQAVTMIDYYLPYLHASFGPPEEIVLLVDTNAQQLNISAAWLEALSRNALGDLNLPFVSTFTKVSGRFVTPALIVLMQFNEVSIGKGINSAYDVSMRIMSTAVAMGGVINGDVYSNSTVGYAGINADYQTAIRNFIISAFDVGKAEYRKLMPRTDPYFQKLDRSLMRGFFEAQAKQAIDHEQADGSVSAPRAASGDHDSKRIGDISEASVGTGFLIAARPLYVTNYHVVAGKRMITIIHDGIEAPEQATVVAEDAASDLAILTSAVPVPQAVLPKLSSSSEVNAGDHVYTFGYPMGDAIGKGMKFNDGAISAKTGPANEPRLYQISVPVIPGNSGAALLSVDGRIVGVVSSTLNQSYGYQVAGVITTSIGYAVKSDYITLLCDSAGLSADLSGGQRKLLTMEQAQAITVRIDAKR